MLSQKLTIQAQSLLTTGLVFLTPAFSIVGVLMKFTTKAVITSLSGIVLKRERERTVKFHEWIVVAHRYCRKLWVMMHYQPLWKISDQSGITLPSSQCRASYCERTFEPVHQDGMVCGVESGGKIKGDENGNTPKIYLFEHIGLRS